MQVAGKTIIAVGIFLVIFGLIIYFIPNKFNWLGRLPGDFKLGGENFKLYIPLTSSVIIFAVITLIVQIIRRLF